METQGDPVIDHTHTHANPFILWVRYHHQPQPPTPIFPNKFFSQPAQVQAVQEYPQQKLFLILAALNTNLLLLQPTPQILIDGKRNGLTGGNTHDTRRNTHVKAPDSLSLPHGTGNGDYAADGRFAGLGWRLLETGLDGVDGGVGKGTHGAGEEADDGGLPAWYVGVAVVFG